MFRYVFEQEKTEEKRKNTQIRKLCFFFRAFQFNIILYLVAETLLRLLTVSYSLSNILKCNKNVQVVAGVMLSQFTLNMPGMNLIFELVDKILKRGIQLQAIPSFLIIIYYVRQVAFNSKVFEPDFKLSLLK